jgi:hypothetical protein
MDKIYYKGKITNGKVSYSFLDISPDFILQDQIYVRRLFNYDGIPALNDILPTPDELDTLFSLPYAEASGSSMYSINPHDKSILFSQDAEDYKWLGGGVHHNRAEGDIQLPVAAEGETVFIFKRTSQADLEVDLFEQSYFKHGDIQTSLGQINSLTSFSTNIKLHKEVDITLGTATGLCSLNTSGIVPLDFFPAGIGGSIDDIILSGENLEDFNNMSPPFVEGAPSYIGQHGRMLTYVNHLWTTVMPLSTVIDIDEIEEDQIIKLMGTSLVTEDRTVDNISNLTAMNANGTQYPTKGQMFQKTSTAWDITDNVEPSVLYMLFWEDGTWVPKYVSALEASLPLNSMDPNDPSYNDRPSPGGGNAGDFHDDDPNVYNTRIDILNDVSTVVPDEVASGEVFMFISDLDDSDGYSVLTIDSDWVLQPEEVIDSDHFFNPYRFEYTFEGANLGFPGIPTGHWECRPFNIGDCTSVDKNTVDTVFDSDGTLISREPLVGDVIYFSEEFADSDRDGLWTSGSFADAWSVWCGIPKPSDSDSDNPWLLGKWTTIVNDNLEPEDSSITINGFQQHLATPVTILSNDDGTAYTVGTVNAHPHLSTNFFLEKSNGARPADGTPLLFHRGDTSPLYSSNIWAPLNWDDDNALGKTHYKTGLNVYYSNKDEFGWNTSQHHELPCDSIFIEADIKLTGLRIVPAVVVWSWTGTNPNKNPHFGYMDIWELDWGDEYPPHGTTGGFAPPAGRRTSGWRIEVDRAPLDSDWSDSGDYIGDGIVTEVISNTFNLWQNPDQNEYIHYNRPDFGTRIDKMISYCSLYVPEQPPCHGEWGDGGNGYTAPESGIINLEEYTEGTSHTLIDSDDLILNAGDIVRIYYIRGFGADDFSDEWVKEWNTSTIELFGDLI